ncbi:hypothetical protein Q3G72_002247 [Acer saccharum]|nr:hypothetical protein Q3G72_002247 [Acer saccharum]
MTASSGHAKATQLLQNPVVHLNLGPRLKDAKWSMKSKIDESCETCGRYLEDLPNQFWSIAYKSFNRAKSFP